MYYNIKIKCDDSELTLESDNINVTQREMDIYFAHFFDVSEEYSKKINAYIPKKSAQIIPEVKNTILSDANASSSLHIANISSVDEEIKTFDISKDVDFKNNDVIESDSLCSQISGEVKLTNNDILEENLLSEPVAIPDDKDILQNGGLDIIEPNPQHTLVPTPSMQDIECLAAVSPIDYDVSIPVYNYEEYQNNELSAIFQTPTYVEPKNEQIPVLDVVDTASKPTATEVCNTPYFEEPDFPHFLASCRPSDIYDEFLICAYYIKRITRQGAFMIKYINSKLFAATGRIADTKVIQGLVDKNFIKVVDTNDIKMYSITQEGEKYFIKRFVES